MTITSELTDVYLALKLGRKLSSFELEQFSGLTNRALIYNGEDSEETIILDFPDNYLNAIVIAENGDIWKIPINGADPFLLAPFD